MAYIKGARSGSEGNTRLQSQYGGGSTAPRQSYAPGYATGGRVAGNPALDEGMAAAEGAPAKATFGRGKRVGTKKAPSKDKSGPKINIVIAQAPKEDKMAGMEGMPPMPPGPPGGPPPMGPPMAGPPPGPPMPPPGAPPMRAAGGRVVTRKTGGRVKKEDGGEVKGKGENGPSTYLDKRASLGEFKRNASDVLGFGTLGVGSGVSLAQRGIGKKLIGGLGTLAGAAVMGNKSMAADKEAKAAKDASNRFKTMDLPDTPSESAAESPAQDKKKGGAVCKQDGGALGGKSRLQRS